MFIFVPLVAVVPSTSLCICVAFIDVSLLILAMFFFAALPLACLIWSIHWAAELVAFIFLHTIWISTKSSAFFFCPGAVTGAGATLVGDLRHEADKNTPFLALTVRDQQH